MRRSGIMDGASVGRSAAPTIYYNMDCTIYTLECIIHSIEYRGMRHRSNRVIRVDRGARGDAASRPVAPPAVTEMVMLVRVTAADVDSDVVKVGTTQDRNLTPSPS